MVNENKSILKDTALQLLGENTDLRITLRLVRENLMLAHAEHSWAKVGTIKYTALIREIDKALNPT